MIFDLLIFNGSLSNILANPELKRLYYDNWLASYSFQHRAIFLRLRMKDLFEKDKEMFEESSRDLGKLKKYSMGDKNSAVSDNFTNGYPKAPVSSDFESFYRTVEVEKSTQDTSVSKTKFDLISEIRLLFGLADGHAKIAIKEPILGLKSGPSQECIDTDPREAPVRSTESHPKIFIPDFEDPGTPPFSKVVDANDVEIQFVDNDQEIENLFPI